MVDPEDKSCQLVVKIANDYKNFASEIKAMRKISKHSYGKHTTPLVVDYGMTIFNGDLVSWLIMPRFGSNLETIFEKREQKLNKASVLDIGIAVIDTFEATHKAGYVFNNLKLDNLMIGYGQKLDKEATVTSIFS